MKPYEVELMVAQLGVDQSTDELYHILYDGTVVDRQGFVAMGGQAEALVATLNDQYREGLTFDEALQLGTQALSGSDPARTLATENLEVAVLDRSRPRRAFRRVSDPDVARVLGG